MNKLNMDYRKQHKIVFYLIISLWFVIFIFAIVSLNNPKWLVDLTESNKKQEVLSIVSDGIELSSRHLETQAIHKYEKALDLIPDFAEAQINLAVSYKRMGKYKRAIIEFNKALNMCPDDSSNIYSNLKDIYLEYKDTLIAKSYFRKSINSTSNIITKLMKAGNFFLSMKELDSAYVYYNASLLKRLQMKTYYEIALMKNNNESLSDFIVKLYDKVLFNRMLNNDKGLAENYNKIGFVLALQKKYNTALSFFYKATSIWWGYRDANENIRYIKEKLKIK